MDQRTSEIVEEIFEERQRLGDDMAELEQKVKEATNVRGYFARKPWIAIGLAVTGGLLLSALFMPKSR
jgi:ElaB/YqjD/DUF883 family membrane-anchored ribosome-binding protein